MTPPTGYTPLYLSTDPEAAPRRAELAREVFGRQILRVEVEPLPGDDLRTDLILQGLPGVKLISGYAHGMTTARTPSLLDDGNDDVMVGLGCAEGRFVTEQRGEQVVLQDGDIRVMSNAERFSLTHLDSRAPGIMVSRKALVELVPDLDDRIRRPVPRRPNGLHLLLGYIGMVAAMPVFEHPEIASVAATHIQDLLAHVIGPSQEGAEIIAARGLKAARLRAIKADIERALMSHRQLSLEAVAAAHRLSPRYLQRLFEGEGTTFSGHVVGQRLAYARRLLRDPRFADRTISTIAYECGFRDISHFNRMFRRLHGLTPSDTRAQAGSRDRGQDGPETS